jgi:hypothetical protein
MQKWEYQTITLKREHKIGILSTASTEWQPPINLRQLGEEGWELISIAPLADVRGFTDQLQYTFKRPKG